MRKTANLIQDAMEELIFGAGLSENVREQLQLKKERLEEELGQINILLSKNEENQK